MYMEESTSRNIQDTSEEDRREGLGLPDAKMYSKAIVTIIEIFV